MIASFVLARLAAQAGVAQHRSTGRAFATAPQNAVEFLRRRAQLPPEEVDRLRQVYGNEAARVTRRLTDHVEAKVQVAMRQAVAEGMHVREGAAFLGQAIADAGIASANPFLLETLFRTQNALAYSAGRWTADQDPAVQEILWGYEYWTVGDDRVRPNHVLLDRMRLAKEDPRWEQLWPPNGFNCRCLLIEVWNSDAEAGSAVEPPSGPQTVQDPATGQQVEAVARPDKGWEFNPGQAIQLPAAKAPIAAVVKKARAAIKAPVRIAAKARKKVQGIPIEGTGKPLASTEKEMLARYTSYEHEEIVAAQLGKPMPFLSKLTKPAALKRAKQIERGLKKLPGKSGTSWRGLKFESVAEQQKFLSSFQLDQVHEFQAFQSASAREAVAKSFMSRQKTGQSIMLRIEGKTGRDVAQFSRNQAEAEILFMRGSKFTVTKIEGNVIHLMEI